MLVRLFLMCLPASILPVQTPPAILQIVRETILPGGEAKYDEIERALARLCAEQDCPNRYLAMASADSPTEVWWFNTYASQADVQRIADAYAARPELTAEMTRLADGKKAIVRPTPDVFYVPARAQTRGVRWRVGETPYAVVTETLNGANAGFAFTAPNGRALRIETAATQEDAARLAARWGPPARVLALRLEWSRR